MKKDKHLGIRVDKELHYKLHYISRYEGRSGNAQILYLIRQCIAEFEKTHGEIEADDKKWLFLIQCGNPWKTKVFLPIFKGKW